MPLTKVGTAGLYAGVATLSHGEAFTWHYEAATGAWRRAARGLPDAPDSRKKPAAEGRAQKMPHGEQDFRRNQA